MSELEAALIAVLEHPDDLGARLSYASALDARHEPLGEFIRLDCRLSGASPDDDASLELWDRRLALLEAHAGSWLAPLSGVAESNHLGRGLVEWVQIDLETLLARGAEIFGRFPIRFLAVRGVHGRMGELLASPWIDRIEHLSLPEPCPLGKTVLVDDDIEELARGDRPRRLRGLDLKYNTRLGPRSVEAILGASWCDELQSLGLGWTSAGDEGASLIASTDRLGNLRRLDLSRCGLGPAGARTLADSPGLARLGLSEFDFSLNHDIAPEGNARLLRSPVLARVESVGLDGQIDAELVDAFEQSESLGSMKTLNFTNSWTIDTISLRRLSRWPGLAGLDSLLFVLSGLNDEHLGILARSPWLADLKSLCLSETRVTDKGVERFGQCSAWQGIEELGIDRHGLTERSVRAILDAAWFPRLTRLDLHASYGIGDAGAAVLASYRGPTRLRRLILSMAGIGDAGALALSGASFAPQLWTLWLRGNPISPTVRDLLARQFGGRVHIGESEGQESWRDQPAPRG